MPIHLKQTSNSPVFSKRASGISPSTLAPIQKIQKASLKENLDLGSVIDDEIYLNRPAHKRRFHDL